MRRNVMKTVQTILISLFLGIGQTITAQEFIGWRWNHINNIEELRSIDTNTGTTTLLNTIPEIESLSSGVDAIDNNSNKLYLIGRSSGDTSSRLFIINSLTGVLLSSVLLDTSVSGIAAVTISTSVETVNLDLPKSIQLLQNYPNPFNTATTINYKLNKSSFINLSVYNVNGELVETLINERNDVGNHSVEWDAESISSDVYFYRITTGEYTETKKCLLLK